MNERKTQLLQGAIDITLNDLTIQLNQSKDAQQRSQIVETIVEYADIRKELSKDVKGSK